MTSSAQGRAAPETAPLTTEANEVESMENALLEGSFREALTLANRFLLSTRCRFLLHRHRRSSFSKKSSNRLASDDYHHHQQQQQQPEPDDDANPDKNTIRIQTSRLSLDGMEERDCHISVCGWAQNNRDEDDAMDRAAAVALQSWYELSKLAVAAAAAAPAATQNNNNNKQAIIANGHRHLRPFLDTYTTPNGKAMSLDLFVIWVQFCRSPALHQMDVATSLTIQVLRKVRRSEQPSLQPAGASEKEVEEGQMDIEATSPMSQKACAELVHLLFVDLLPCYQMRSEQVELLLECLKSESLSVDEILSSIVVPRRTTSSRNGDDDIRPCKDVIQQCLCFCNTDDGNWPVWLQDSFCECRAKLQAMLREMYQRQQKLLDRKQQMDCDKSTTDRSDKEIPDDAAQHSTRLVLSQDHKLSLTNVKSWKFMFVQFFRSLRLRLKTFGPVLQPHQRQTIQVAVLTLCLMYGWRRHRHRISAAGRDAATAVLWKPAMEILEAFGFKV